MSLSKPAASAIAAGMADALFPADPTPPGPTAPSVAVMAGSPTSVAAFPWSSPTLSDWDIAASKRWARFVGDSAVLHHAWLPHREAECEAAAGEPKARPP